MPEKLKEVGMNWYYGANIDIISKGVKSGVLEIKREVITGVV
jgi:hypothetical protein